MIIKTFGAGVRVTKPVVIVRIMTTIVNWPRSGTEAFLETLTKFLARALESDVVAVLIVAVLIVAVEVMVVEMALFYSEVLS